MMNQDPENQQNEKTEDQDRAEQRRILEERLTEINARSKPEETSPAVGQTQEVKQEEEAPKVSAQEKPQEVAAPVVNPEATQSAVLASEEEIAPAAELPEENVATSQVSFSAAAEPAPASEKATPSVPEQIPSPAASGSAAEQPSEQTVEQPSAQAAEEQPNTNQDQETVAPITGTEAQADALVQPEETAATPESPRAAPESAANNSSAADESHPEEEELEQAEDLNSLPVEEIRSRLLALTQEGQARKVGRSVNELYRAYDLHFQEERGQALQLFTAEGGTEDDFEFHPSPAHKEVEQAMQRFRESKHREHKQEEENKTQNLQRKRDLLERLRVFIESSETQTSGNSMKEIQAEWKAIGPVPNAEAQELWNSYHALLDMYYNNRSILFELKELDRKRNLDAKTVLCERAEALSGEQNINKALQELRHLHDEWKHVGPVPNEARDTIWDRFIKASEQVHDRKKEFFEGRRSEELANLEVKRALLAEMEQFQNIKTDRINDWRDKTDQIQKLKERWDAAGLVPKENAEEINKGFWSSYKSFFHNKNAFFKALDEEKMQNYRQKVALCEEAESLQTSEEWDSTKEKLIQLQKKWKTIGRVPDKYSDKIWNRFRSACNAFFDRLHKEGENREQAIHQQSQAKQDFCEQLSTKVADPTLVGTMDEFKQMHSSWQGMAAEGKRNPKLEDRFQQLLAKYLDKVPELSPDQKEQTLFQLQLNQLKSSPEGEQKLYQKEQHLRREITTLENDISTLNTNIEFFARSKNAEKLREEYQSKINDAQSRIDHLKRQLKALRS